MHYQPSYKSQEPNRILPPTNSVPMTGKEITYKTLEDYTEYFPNPTSGSSNLEAGQQIYTINCLVCHGPTLKGIDENRGEQLYIIPVSYTHLTLPTSDLV